MNRGSTKY